MALKMFLVVRIANKQDIKDVVTFENLEVFEDIRKMQYFRTEGVRKHG